MKTAKRSTRGKRPSHSLLLMTGSIHLSRDASSPRIAGDRILLLEEIERLGSLTAAAKACNLSYKAAWDAVHAMNNLSERPLLEMATGGRGGGGAALTDEGRRVVRIYAEIRSEQDRMLARFGNHIEDFEQYLQLLRRMSMKVSARNSLIGKITEIKKGAVNAVVHIGLKGSETLTASITMESVDGMGLKVGQEILAVIKATSVIIGTAGGTMKLSARNVLAGKIQRLVRGPVMAEVVLGLPGGSTISAIITNESVDTLGLKEGGDAVAIFKASSVIVGVEG